MFKAEQLEMELGDRTYKIEFDREAVKTVESAGALREGAGTFELITAVLYAGMMKHNEVSRRKAKDLVDKALDEGYGLDDFGDVLEEFTRCYKALFTPSASGKTKKSLISHPTAGVGKQ